MPPNHLTVPVEVSEFMEDMIQKVEEEHIEKEGEHQVPPIKEEKLKSFLDDSYLKSVVGKVVNGDDKPDEIEVPDEEEDCEYDNSDALKSIAEHEARKKEEKAQEEEAKRRDEEYMKNPEDDILTEDKMARLYPMPRYNLEGWNNKFINMKTSKVANIFKTENKAYHWYITPNDTWRAFIDADARRELKSDEIVDNAIKFFKNKFNIELQKTDFLVSPSDKLNSYHIFIKKLKGTGKVLKQIFSEFGDKYYPPEEDVKKRIIDTSVYVNHLFRCPYQTNITKPHAHILSDEDLNRIDETVLNNPPPDAIFLDDLKEPDEAVAQSVTEPESKAEIKPNLATSWPNRQTSLRVLQRDLVSALC